MVHLYCHTCWQMVANGGGILLGDSLCNYVRNFCCEASVGTVWVWWCVEGFCIRVWLYMFYQQQILYSIIEDGANNIATLCSLVVACLPVDPRFVGSNLAKVNGFLRAIKIHSVTSFRGEVKPLVLCRRFITCKRALQVWKRCFLGKIQLPCFCAHVSLALLLDDSAGKNSQKALADESGVIRNCARQWACHPLLIRHLTG
jgi:hypothetical protein